MEYNTIFEKRENIYINHLPEISGVKFTNREIDIIACILHRRGEKKIAAILSISPRTVETHSRNITTKMRCNSKDQIIDFVEKSGKLSQIRRYYSSLLMQICFEKYLRKIATINKQTITCVIDKTENKELIKILEELQKDLKLANIFLNISTEVSSGQKLHIYTSINIKEKISDESIGLLFDNNFDPLEVKSINFVNFSPNQNYYFSVFYLLKKIIRKSEIDIVREEFHKEYTAFLTGEESIGIINPIFHKKTNIYQQIKNLRAFILIPIIITVIAVYLFNNQTELPSNTIDSSAQILKLIEPLKQTFKELSVRNLTKEESEQNYNIIQQFSEAVNQISSGQIQTYWNGNELQPTELVNCLYNLNAVASYLLFKEHDAENAEKILKYAKSMAEDYASSRSSLLHTNQLQINFDNKTAEEVHTELAIIKDLPEMYAITIYFLGRSTIYQEDIESAKKYFTLSRDLGKELGLFEEVLSVRNGLGLIDKKQIDINIINGNYEQAKKDSRECINTYQKIKEDGRKYKINYRPNNLNPEIIIPKKDIYNVVDCSRRITDLYTKLIGITDNKNENIGYLEAVSEQYLGANTLTGVLGILTKSNRIAPDSYNSLGFFLLKLYDKGIDFKEFKNNLVKSLNLIDGNDLEIVRSLFEKSKPLSREIEPTKANSYDGLVKVYERLMNIIGITEEEKKHNLLQIQDFKEKRDKINQRLKERC